MKWLPVTGVVLVVVGGAGACNDRSITSPERSVPSISRQQSPQKTTGLVLNSLTNLSIPIVSSILGPLGDIHIDQAEITNFALVENTVGAIVGLQVDGVLQGTTNILGTPVVDENFTTTATVTPSGPGSCDLVNIDLGPIAINALNLASVDLPTVSVAGKTSGVVGTLLCNLTKLLGGLGSGGTATPGAQGVVNALNNQIK
jgi:hypothetical protein